MLRTTTSRSIPRAFERAIASKSNSIASNSARFHSLGGKRPNVVIHFKRLTTTQLLRYATKPGAPQLDKIDQQAEAELRGKKLEVDPQGVTATSSVSKVVQTSPNDDQSGTDEVLGGVKGDLKTIRETFALNEVPRETYYLGAAGTLPYLATSLSTVFLSYNINHAPVTGTNWMFSPDQAHYLLSIIQPIQIGYGAVILSFLGAIHWGLEYAGYGGHHSYRRYAIGVAAPAMAWPTIFMPLEYALISQFVGFTALYFADARATVRGWAPPWYSTYRFVLTFIVGVSIVISLVGRGKVGFEGGKLPGPAEGLKALKEEERAAAGEKESIKEKRAEQLTPGAEGSTKARKEIEEEDDAGNKTRNDEDNGEDDKGGKNEDQGDKEKDQQDEPSKQDEKADQEGAQKGKK